MRVFRLVAITTAVLFSGSLVLGQNLVSNSSFDTDVMGWTALFGASLMWDPLDADGDPLSGSSLVTNIDPDPYDGNGAAQCIDGLNGERTYGFSADINIPGGQIETGHAYLLIQWYSGAGCSGAIGLAESPQVTSATTDAWVTSSHLAQSPAGTQSGRIRLSVLKIEAGGSLDAHFDNAWLEAAIFVDGFESGGLTAWSSSVP